MKSSFLISILILIPVLCNADGYWLQILGSGKPGDAARVQLYYGGVDQDSKRYIKEGKELDKLAGFVVFAVDEAGKKTPIKITRQADHWEGAFVPDKKGSYQIRAFADSLPVVERPETPGSNIRPVHYLCTTYQVGGAAPATAVIQPLEILLQEKDNVVNIQALLANQPVENGTKIRIFNPENWEKLPLTDASGKAYFIPTMKGMYIVRVDWVDKRPGQFLGKSYDSVRHRCDYTFIYR
ncbi:MAG: hypothetical protein BGO21_05465 [Dyadobacter sp. 50-39]|uniref:hypothetical protein n=1 Tax=Dyadobacter sp. 50-39 TaxID=1895756 RepID=UPI00096420B8|nr:hypothetical protein [Dyadobacter sp. 50-39]OJV22603.1 MAG: hypothetical protein BGO21_05465 [Dyadobacter sp. 50-39]